MDSLFKSIAEQASVILVVLAVGLAVLAFFLIRLSARVAQMQTQWRELLSDTQTGNLELLLKDHLLERMRLQSQLEEAQSKIHALEEKMTTAKRHVGLVRFDAFEDVGGAQSFALAVYDDNGNGAVLNGLVGRTDCRVYCKPLVAGRSDRTLAQEESLAIEDAVSRAPRAVITP